MRKNRNSHLNRTIFVPVNISYFENTGNIVGIISITCQSDVYIECNPWCRFLYSKAAKLPCKLMFLSAFSRHDVTFSILISLVPIVNDNNLCDEVYSPYHKEASDTELKWELRITMYIRWEQLFYNQRETCSC